MSYFLMAVVVLFLGGVLSVSSNPAPFFGAIGLMMCGAFCCLMLAIIGAPFLALILFLIYLGGMLVVFGYSAAFSSDPYPDTLGNASVFEHLAFYVMGLVVALIYVGPPIYKFGVGVVNVVKEFMVVRADMAGVATFYGVGGMMMLFCGWVLLLTLFVVLELIRGRSRGALRAP
uniref:NADH-ubiquinone oxidoreductase chain 6 n=1 Tax=Escualosa thoracata TaxID=454032 RepID=H1UCF7_9TELE|nr:NADH dehydrogenase subunit 6 [Escualosa thoracata]BAL43828.1 NADH dehydrogenase subunit 6 [Escualosa thoracata]